MKALRAMAAAGMAAAALGAAGCAGGITHARHGGHGGTLYGVSAWDLADAHILMAEHCQGRFHVVRDGEAAALRDDAARATDGGAPAPIHYECADARTARRD